MDYGLLNQAAQDIKGLSPEISRVKNVAHLVGRGEVTYSVPGQTNNDNTDLGPSGTLFESLGRFYGSWSGDMSNAMDGLDKLAGYFQGIADSFMETDASQAAGFNESAMMSAMLRYPQQVDEYYQILANAQKAGKPLPTYPAAPQNPYALSGTSGLSTSFTTGDDTAVPAADKTTHAPNQILSSETTSVTSDGMHYSETTTFGADKGWGPDGPTQDTTQVITNPDGSTDTLKTTLNTDGSGSMTDTDSASGNTNTYTRSGWNASWVDTTPPSSDSSSGSDSESNWMTTWDGGA
jgi:hypothetical protein